MRFQVPQFIEVEDKIFGPLTLKQFIYLAGGVGATVILFNIFSKLLAVLFSAPIIALSLALTFFKINNRSFVILLGIIVQIIICTFKRSKQRNHFYFKYKCRIDHNRIINNPITLIKVLLNSGDAILSIITILSV